MGNSNTKKLSQQTSFDKQDIKDLKRSFRKISFNSRNKKDQDPKLDPSQFQKMIQIHCGLRNYEINTEQIFEAIDLENKRYVSLEGFLFWLYIFKKGSFSSKLKNLFQFFDRSRKGAICDDDKIALVKRLKEAFDKRGCDGESLSLSMTRFLDQDKDGLIGEQEWVEMGEQGGLIQVLFGRDFFVMLDDFSFSPKNALTLEKQKSNSKNSDIFNLLPIELRQYIFSRLTTFKPILNAMCVNRKWRDEMETYWYNLCYSKQYLEHEKWWLKRDKNWKWIFHCCNRRFEDDGTVRNGTGTYESARSIYVGEWKDGKKHGWGKITWKVGGCYLGEWSFNFREGFGHQVYSGSSCEGDIYEGDWRRSHRDGYGTYHWKTSNDKYEGEWRLGKKQGHGIFIFAKSGNKYEGAYETDKRNGYGVFIWMNGDQYKGSWVSGAKNGVGTYTWKSGMTYTGTWKKNLKMGSGVLTWTSGAKYDGSWARNKINGTGVYTWPNGDYYRGGWNNNSRAGEGYLFIAETKTKIEQVWQESPKSLSSMSDLPRYPTTDASEENQDGASYESDNECPEV